MSVRTINYETIPVDGPDKKFCKQLERKGFVKVTTNPYLEKKGYITAPGNTYRGLYDDMPSYITVLANNDHNVYRVVVTTSGEIVSRYNQLLRDFLSSEKYLVDTTLYNYRPIEDLQ